MARVLIVDDQISDVRRAASIVTRLGFKDVQAVSRVDTGIMRLEEALEGKAALPDLIILDLSFSDASGFEILRFWRSHQKLRAKTRVVVWTQMHDPEQALARCFGAEVVPKWGDPGELESAVRRSGKKGRA